MKRLLLVIGSWEDVSIMMTSEYDLEYIMSILPDRYEKMASCDEYIYPCTISIGTNLHLRWGTQGRPIINREGFQSQTLIFTN